MSVPVRDFQLVPPLPLRLLRLDCRFSRPVVLPDVQGAGLGGADWLPVRKLHGAFKRSLLAVGCTAAREGGSPCKTVGRDWCSREGCPVPALYTPRSPVTKQDLPRRFQLDAPDLDELGPIHDFSCRLACLGRVAVDSDSLLIRALEQTGKTGLEVEGRPEPFSLTGIWPVGPLPLDRYVEEALPARLPLVARVELESPVELRGREPSEAPEPEELLSHLFRSVAVQLTIAACHEDGATLTRDGVSASESAAAMAALTAAAACSLTAPPVLRSHRLRARAHGGHQIELLAHTGQLTLALESRDAARLLVLLDLLGAGGHRSWGLGRVRAWLSASHESGWTDSSVQRG